MGDSSENRTILDAELMFGMLILALPAAHAFVIAHVGAPACRARHPIWPASRTHVLYAVVRNRQIQDRFLERFGLIFACTTEPVSVNEFLVKYLTAHLGLNPQHDVLDGRFAVLPTQSIQFPTYTRRTNEKGLFHFRDCNIFSNRS